MKRLITTILSTVLLFGTVVASEYSTTPPARSSQRLKSFSSNHYNKEIDYNWYGWQKFKGSIEIGNDYVVLPDGKGRFDLNMENVIADAYVGRRYISFEATNQNGDPCRISITCFTEGNCIIVLSYDQKSWAYKCSKPIRLDFKPLHTVW